MNTDLVSEIRKKAFEKRKRFSEDCEFTFGNGEKMSAKLAEFGIEVSPPTCRSWIDGYTNPSILKAYSIRAVIDILDEQKIAEIRDRQSRARAI